MLTPSKTAKLNAALKSYAKTYLHGKITELDESGTRLMINAFLTNVLGYVPIEEVKTEYMIRGTYADYVVQLKGTRHFLVEVKALSFALVDKHLRQAINYGANEGIEWALLTNGKSFDLYRILFNKPIESRKVFSFDLSNAEHLKQAVGMVQFLHKDSVANKGLDQLWSKAQGLDAHCIAGLLYSPQVVSFLKRTLKGKYKCKFTDDEIETSIGRLITQSVKMEDVKPNRAKRDRAKRKSVPILVAAGDGPTEEPSGSTD